MLYVHAVAIVLLEWLYGVTHSRLNRLKSDTIVGLRRHSSAWPSSGDAGCGQHPHTLWTDRQRQDLHYQKDYHALSGEPLRIFGFTNQRQVQRMPGNSCLTS